MLASRRRKADDLGEDGKLGQVHGRQWLRQGEGELHAETDQVEMDKQRQRLRTKTDSTRRDGER